MTHKLAAPTPALQAAVADYLDWHALRGSSLRHRQDIRRMLLAFAAAVDPERPVDQVTREDCTALLRNIQERGSKPNTLKTYHRVLDAFFNWLLQEERLQDSPMKRVPKPKLPQEQIKPLTPEELARLLAQPDRKTFIGLRDAAFIALLADTGLRVSEAVRIRMVDVDERLHSVTVVGKGEKPRTVFYGEAVEALLKSYLRRRRSAPARRPRPRENYPGDPGPRRRGRDRRRSRDGRCAPETL
jgi:site-specific recombinase XerD